MRPAFVVLLAFLLMACRPETTATLIPSAEPFPPSVTSPPAAPATRPPTTTQTIAPTPTVSPAELKRRAAPICENAFSALIETGPLSPPFAVMKKETYADAPSWELSHPLPHLGSLSAADVKTLFCISETRTQTGTYTDGSAAYQLSWEARVVSWPGGKVIGKQSFAGSLPPKTKDSGSGAGAGSYPDSEFANWVFQQIDHPDFLYFDNAITCLAISPNGGIAAFGSALDDQLVNKDYQAKIYLFHPDSLQTDLGTSAFLDVLEGHQGMVTSLAFSPDGATLASSGYDLFIKFWDVTRGSLLGQVSIADTPNHLAFSDDGTRLAVASNLEVTIVDPVSRQVTTSVAGAGGNRLAFSPDGSHVYVNALGSMKVVDTTANRVTLTFPDPFTLVPTISVSSDGTVLGVTYQTPESVEGFALSPDGSQIITHTMGSVEGSSSTENIRLATWDAETGKYVGEVKFPGSVIRSIRFSPDGELLAMGNGTQVWIWDTATWQVTEKREGHIDDIVDLAFNPEGGSLISASRDGTVRVWALDE